MDYIKFWHSDNEGITGDIREIVTNGGRLDVAHNADKAQIVSTLPETVSVIVCNDPSEVPDLHNQRNIPVVWNTQSFAEADISGGKCINIVGKLQLADGVT